MEIEPAIREYYEKGEEVDRLSGGFPSGPLERARTEEIITRYLAPGPLEILDVGGGPGVYAAWLADQGHHVHLIDPVPLHIEQATQAHKDIGVELGDARRLSQGNASADVVLLLGPLYHLTDRADRIQALQEALRVLRPDGLLFAAAISRYAALLDLLLRLGRIHDDGVFELVEGSVRTGVFGGPGRGALFTTSYFHQPEELADEVAEAGFEEPQVFPVDGPGAFATDFEERWADESQREALMAAARLAEDQPGLIATTGHLLAVARAPG